MKRTKSKDMKTLLIAVLLLVGVGLKAQQVIPAEQAKDLLSLNLKSAELNTMADMLKEDPKIERFYIYHAKQIEIIGVKADGQTDKRIIRITDLIDEPIPDELCPPLCD